MEKRIHGIKMIADQVKSNRHSLSRGSTRILQDLIDLEVFENVFGGAKFHLNIVQRATELISLFAFERGMN